MRRRADPTRACRRTPRRRQPCSSDRSIVRAHVSAAGAKGGQEGGARPLARRLHHQDPRQIGRLRRHLAFDLTGGEASDRRDFETLLDIGPDIQPRAVIARQRLRQQGQSGRSESARRRAGHPAQGQRKRQAGLLRAHPLQGKGSHRAGRRTAQAVQARRAPMEKTARNFRLSSPSPQASADQIRPHRLVTCGV